MQLVGWAIISLFIAMNMSSCVVKQQLKQ